MSKDHIPDAGKMVPPEPGYEQERVNFERFMRDRITPLSELKRDPGGHYIWRRTSDMWQGWQARAELVGFTDSTAILVKALEEIEEWTLRYTTKGHPIATVARKALDAHRKQGGDK